MKYVVNFLKGVLFSIWLVIAIFSTICLIQFNKYGVSEFGKSSLLIIDEADMHESIKVNDLVVTTQSKEYKVGDYIFFYNSNGSVNFAEVTDINKTEGAIPSYAIEGGQISSDKIIGTLRTAKIYKGFGIVLKIFESRWGFMFLVILPTLYLLVYEIYSLIVEVKKEVKKEIKQQNKVTEE